MMMTLSHTVRLSAILLAVLAFTARLQAADEGQEDLDKAVEVQLFAETPADLDKVVELCESALRKGLAEDDQQVAKDLIASSLFQHATALTRPILGEQPDPRWVQFRTMALPKLRRAVQVKEDFGDAFYLLAKLQSLPGGNKNEATEAVNKAVRLAGDDKRKTSEALLLRGSMAENENAKLADYNQAVKIDPTNQEAWKTRAIFYLSQDKLDEATADFAKLLETDEKNITARHGLAEALTHLGKLDEALEHIGKAIEIDPKSSMNYSLRARIHAAKNDPDAALKDLDSALKIEPRSVAALLMRGRLHQAMENNEAARRDAELALVLAPDLEQAILLRAIVAGAGGDFLTATKGMKKLLAKDPKNIPWKLQLATFYVADQRPRKAIKTFEEILELDAENVAALRGQADAMLSVGLHAEAIKNYEEALTLEPEDSGVLNNLAWVLATSPKEDLRNGKRSVELGKKACEVTEYKAAHILSTLAAGYAEQGDYKTAMTWSEKAVAMGEGEMKQQLQKELDSYKSGKPWRELQEIEEKPEPTRGGGDFEL